MKWYTRGLRINERQDGQSRQGCLAYVYHCKKSLWNEVSAQIFRTKHILIHTRELSLDSLGQIGVFDETVKRSLRSEDSIEI
jgi:hypothetical protein